MKHAVKVRGDMNQLPVDLQIAIKAYFNTPLGQYSIGTCESIVELEPDHIYGTSKLTPVFRVECPVEDDLLACLSIIKLSPDSDLCYRYLEFRKAKHTRVGFCYDPTGTLDNLTVAEFNAKGEEILQLLIKRQITH